MVGVFFSLEQNSKFYRRWFLRCRHAAKIPRLLQTIAYESVPFFFLLNFHVLIVNIERDATSTVPLTPENDVVV